MQADSCDTSIRRGIHQFCLCGMPYWSGKPQIQGESHMLVDGRTRRDIGDGLVVQQPHRYWLWTTQCGILIENRTRVDEDWMKLFWTIYKPLPLKWSLHWWMKGHLMISMVIKAGMCALHVVTSFRKCILKL